MSPSEFFQLHPREFWWLVEGWNEQDEKRPGRGGLSKRDADNLRSMLREAKRKHEEANG